MNDKYILVKDVITKYLISEFNINGDLDEKQELMKDYGIDSLGILKMVIVIEEELGIVIPDEELSQSEEYSLGQMIDFFADRYEN